jgi:hypothetical protein
VANDDFVAFSFSGRPLDPGCRAMRAVGSVSPSNARLLKTRIGDRLGLLLAFKNGEIQKDSITNGAPAIDSLNHHDLTGGRV